MEITRSTVTPMQRGFTLIELIMVIAILAILASITAPSMRSFIKAAAVRGAYSDFYAALITARSEAIKQRCNVVVAASGSSWKAGWTVTVPACGTKPLQTLQTGDALDPDVAVQVGVPAAATSPITYRMNGRPDAAQTVIFSISGNASIAARCVSIDINGLPRVRTDGNKDSTDGCN